MSQQDPPDNSKAGILNRILNYMDRPWKAIVIIVLLVLCAFGYGIWEERKELIEVFKPKPTVRAVLQVGKIPEALAKLVAQTDADIAALWSVELHGNAARFESGRLKNGPWSFNPPRVPFIVNTSEPGVFIQLFAGQVVCALLNSDSQALKRLSLKAIADEGITRVCVISIPTTPDVLLAVLIIGWKTPSSPEGETATIGAAVETARSLVNWY